MKGTKRKQVALLFIISLFAMFCMGVGLSYAYFSASLTTTEQTLTFGKLALNVSKTSESTNTKVISLTGTNLGQGDSITVDGQIALESNSVDAYIRMRPNVVITPDTGKTLDETARKDFTDKFLATFFGLNTTWLKSTSVSDDFYYCADRLTGGEAYTGWITSSGWAVMSVKESNFKGTIKIEELGSSWQGASVTISFDLQAIQAKGTVDISGWTTSTTTQEKVNDISNSGSWSVFLTDKLSFIDTTVTIDGETVSGVKVVLKAGVEGEVRIPKKYGSLDVFIVDGTFANYTSESGLTSIVIEDGIKSISNKAFKCFYSTRVGISYTGSVSNFEAVLADSDCSSCVITVECSDGSKYMYTYAGNGPGKLV